MSSRVSSGPLAADCLTEHVYLRSAAQYTSRRTRHAALTSAAMRCVRMSLDDPGRFADVHVLCASVTMSGGLERCARDEPKVHARTHAAAPTHLHREPPATTPSAEWYPTTVTVHVALCPRRRPGTGQPSFPSPGIPASRDHIPNTGRPQSRRQLSESQQSWCKLCRAPAVG
jgi:hypothetical protein